MNENMTRTTARCNEVANQVNTVIMRINKQEAEYASVHEQMILFRARMDKIEGNVSELFMYNKESEKSNSYAQQMEIGI